jgi:hypothetical protein
MAGPAGSHQPLTTEAMHAWPCVTTAVRTRDRPEAWSLKPEAFDEPTP